MMKPIDNTFLKQLIESDFLFSKSNENKRNLKLVNSSISFKEKTTFNILNIFKLNTSLTQYIRILQFLMKSKPFHIYILCRDKYYLSLTKRLLTMLSLSKCVSISSMYPAIEKDKKKAKFLFLLGNIKINDNFYAKMHEEKAWLVTKLNLNLERKLFGFYKIQNELDDYKKLVLLLVIINKVIIKK